MSENQQDIISLLVNKRAFELAGSKVLLNKDYAIRRSELETVTAYALKTLGPENRHLIDEIEELQSTISCLDIEYAYKQGLYDGIRILGDISSIGGRVSA